MEDEFEPPELMMCEPFSFSKSSASMRVVERPVNSSLVSWPNIELLSRVHARPLTTRRTINCGAKHCTSSR